MDQEIVDLYMARVGEIEERFTAKEPESYLDIVQTFADVVMWEMHADKRGPSVRVEEFETGHYQGSNYYIIAPRESDRFYIVGIGYGSCSLCDTLQGIQDEPLKEKRIPQYMTLCLHIAQEVKRIEFDKLLE